MNGLSRVSNVRALITTLVLITAAASSGVASASASVVAVPPTPAPAQHASDADSDDGPHATALLFVLIAAAGYAMHRQQSALESLHTTQNVS